MPTKITQQSIKFFSELVNGSDFDENTTEYTTTLADNVTGCVMAEIEVDVFSDFSISNYQFLYGETSSDTDKYKIYKEDGQFVTDGIYQGCTLRWIFYSGDTDANAIDGYDFYVDAVTEDTINLTWNGDYVVDKGFDPETYINTKDNSMWGRNENGNDFMAVVPEFTGLEFAYNLVENSTGNPTLISDLTNTTNITRVTGIPTTVDGSTQTGAPTSNNKAWVTGDLKVELTEDSLLDNNTLYSSASPGVSTQNPIGKRYKITHYFTIPYYYDGEDDSLEGTEDAPTLYKGVNSPKYIYQTKWLQDYTNPNSGQEAVYDTEIGNSGYFNEAFNGFGNPFTVESISYQVDSQDVDALQIGEVNDVYITIKTDGSFNFQADQAVVVAHGAVVDSGNYQYSTDEFNTVWSFDTIRYEADATPTAGTGIFTVATDYASTLPSDTMTVYAQLDLSSAKAPNIEEDQYYVLAVQIRDESGTTTNVAETSKVHLLADYQQYIKNNDVDGLFGVSRFEQIPHPNELDSYDLGGNAGYTNAQYDIEEGGLSLVQFWLNTAETPELTDLYFKVLVVDTDTSDIHELRSVKIDLSNSVYANGAWQISLNETIGFPLADGDQFNYKTIETGQSVGDKQFYNAYFGYKIPWQDWLAWADAPSDFFDATKENNGLNNNASNYSGDPSKAQVRLAIEADVTMDGNTTTYLTYSEEIKVYDYDEDDTGGATYTCSVGTYRENGTSLENNIIESDYTKVIGTFTPATAPVFTTSIDFTEVSSDWNRFAHGSLYEVTGQRFGDWTNNIADDDDTFYNASTGTSLTKVDASLYTSTSNTIETNGNCTAFHGCYSIDTYSIYSITGSMFSTNTVDNDAIVYTIAFNVDSMGVENTLSILASPSGVSPEINPNYDSTADPTSSNARIFYQPTNPHPNPFVSLVYNYGRPDSVVIDTISGGTNYDYSDGWGDFGDCDFEVTRTNNEITINIDWALQGADSLTDSITYDLNDNDYTTKFLGEQAIGFGMFSQDLGGFKDVDITIPADDFWGTVKIETENSNSDNGLYELSTIYEGNSSNLLENTNNLASLDWDGTSFYVSALVNTDLITSGQTYKLSSEIGAKDLGDVLFLMAFAWVDQSDNTILKIQTNWNVSGASVNVDNWTISNGATVTGFYTYGDGNIFGLQLDTGIETGDGVTVTYGGSTIITPDSRSLVLQNTTIDVYDI